MEFNIDLSDDSSLLDNDDGDGDSMDRTSESLFPSDTEDEKGRQGMPADNVVGPFRAIQWSRSSQQSNVASVNGLDLLAQSAYMSQCSCPECSPPSHSNEVHPYQHVTPAMAIINENNLGSGVNVAQNQIEYQSGHSKVISIPATLPSQLPIPGIPLPNYGTQNIRKRKQVCI
jgi:hypothetical protein